MRIRFFRRAGVFACLVSISFPQLGSAYSVLTHEAMVDAMWDVKIKRILLHAYPNATAEQLKDAHAYAYGGAIIQDIGYYPYASEQFSDLTHYVRTGDFIFALIRESTDINELAFSLGALSHYAGDMDGHRYATNIAEPMLYPKLRHKYGDDITYEQDPVGHLQTEFGFDVLEVARGNFAPQAYHDFIGFNVAKGVLQRGFRDTYGLDLDDLFSDFDRAMNSYRRDVSKIIPRATRIAWAQKEDQIKGSQPSMTRLRFVFVMSRSSYEREWGKEYDKVTASDRIFAFLLKLLPPVGPLRALKFKMPTPEVETLFMASFDRAASQYGRELDASAEASLQLNDINYDVGVVTAAGTYRLQDNIEAFWVDKLAKKNFQTVTADMGTEILEFYNNLDAPIATKKDQKKWAALKQELVRLRGAIPTAAGQQ